MSAARNILFTSLTCATLLLTACGGGGNGGAPPALPVADSFSWTGNTRMTVFAAQGLLANDPAGTVITAADTTTSLGGSVSVDLATGGFVYEPPVGAQNLDDSFSYTTAGAAPTAVTVNLAERIWYVRNTDTGANQGTLTAPFTSLAQAETASDVNDTIFIFAASRDDTGQDTGIALKDGQRLLGEGVGLRVNGVPIVDPFPPAVISNIGLGGLAGDTPVVLLDGTNGNEVAGLTILAGFNEGVLALGGGGHDIHDNTIDLGLVNGREGIRLLNVNGTNRVFGNTITDSPRDGIKVANNENQAGDPVTATPVNGTLDISLNTVTAPARDGIRIDLDGLDLVGSTTNVALHLLTNTVSTPGSAAGDEGINVNSLGAASLTAVLSRNSVSGSSDEAIDLQTDGTASLAAFVANNALSGSAAGASDFRASVADGSSGSACLELLNNVNPTANSTFTVANNATNSGTVELFDAGDNDTAVTTVGTITPVTQNACGVALDGALLFKANCGVCHVGNGMGQGNVGPNLTNATAATIDFQLTNNPAMSFISLTADEIDAIALALAAAP